MILIPLFAFLSSAETYNFITSEVPQLYTFNCNEGVEFRYMPLTSYKLILRASQEVICQKTSLSSNQTSPISLTFDQHDNFLESQELGFELEPLTVTCKCSAAEGTCALSPVVVQSVTSDTGILVMGIISIVMVVITISIISVQFCTFHHAKAD